VSVYARLEGRGQEGVVVVVGQGVENDHTTPEELIEERRREGRRCAMSEAVGKSGIDEANEEEEKVKEEEEKKEEERVPPGWRGREREGGQTG